jgi:hypothetical protein
MTSSRFFADFLVRHSLQFFTVGMVVSVVAAGCTSTTVGGSRADASATEGGPCTPGQQVACTCDDGSSSTQVCADDGTGFGACAACPGAAADGGGEAGKVDGGKNDGGTASGGDSGSNACANICMAFCDTAYNCACTPCATTCTVDNTAPCVTYNTTTNPTYPVPTGHGWQRSSCGGKTPGGMSIAFGMPGHCAEVAGDATAASRYFCCP